MLRVLKRRRQVAVTPFPICLSCAGTPPLHSALRPAVPETSIAPDYLSPEGCRQRWSDYGRLRKPCCMDQLCSYYSLFALTLRSEVTNDSAVFVYHSQLLINIPLTVQFRGYITMQSC